MVDQTRVVAEGRLVRLREKRPEDVVNDYAWRTDPELAAFDATYPLAISFKQFKAEYEFELNNPGLNRRRFAIETLDGEHIGNCSYFNVDEVQKQAEVGIQIGNRAYWGRHYGRDALKALLKHIFTTTDLERVYLHTLDWNIRAQRCFAACGFRECRRFTQGRYRFVMMEIRRQEFFDRLAAEAGLKSEPRRQQVDS
jgi:RimJ/RimL family protein N-acetyltransferase